MTLIAIICFDIFFMGAIELPGEKNQNTIDKG